MSETAGEPEGDPCSWHARCSRERVAHVWKETRPGLIVEDEVCAEGFTSARALGYHEGYPPSVERSTSPSGCEA